MYSYTKKKKFPKRKMIVGLSALLVVAVAFLSYEYTLNKEKDTAVFNEDDVPVLTLPANAAKEKAKKPFQVDAKVVLDYFDGSEGEVDSITEFEGVFRGNQGMDYALDNQAFDVTACFSGKVSEVKDDSVFGKSVTITTDDLDITYQSLGETGLKQGDEVKGEKDVQKEALKESIEANDGKKPGVFAHYFKGKNKRSTKSKDTPENKFTKSKKEDSVDVLQSENVVVDSEIEKLGIADLVETQTDAPLDQLFETIVVDAAKDDEKTQPKKEDGKEEAPKPKKRGRPKKKKDDTEEKDVKETKPKAKSKGRKKKDEFMDDILEAQEIIFDDGSADSSSKKDKEGRK